MNPGEYILPIGSQTVSQATSPQIVTHTQEFASGQTLYYVAIVNNGVGGDVEGGEQSFTIE